MSITVPIYGFGGGGGTSLNFDVKAYATEDALLAATPKENTIGIITENKITCWIFSSTEPAEPVAGMVWISIGTSSEIEFNALKKNGIQVYPLSAKQYVDGAFKPVNAYMYRDGTWEQWAYEITYLYNRGDTCNDITGGWNFNKNQSGGVVGNITYNADHVVLTQVGNQDTFVTVNRVDLVKYHKMEIVYKYDLTASANEAFCRFGLVDTNTEPRPTLVAAVDMPESDVEKTVEMDIPSDVNNLYVCVTQQYKGIVKIYEIRLS